VIDFVGFGGNPNLIAGGNGAWQLTSNGLPAVTFNVTGGGALANGDYAFLPTGAAPTTPNAVSLSVNAVDGDGFINAADAAGGLTLSGTALDTLSADLAGQTVTVTLNGKTYGGVVTAGGGWSLTIAAADVQALADNQAYQITAAVTDSTGVRGAVTQVATTDETASLSIAMLGTNGLLTVSGAPLVISGTSLGGAGSGDFAGQSVTVTLGGASYLGVIAQNGAWSVSVGASAIAALSDGAAYLISAGATDGANNAATASQLVLIQGSGLASGSNVLEATASGQTLTGAGADQTLYGYSGGGDTFKGLAADLNGDTLVNFGRAGDKLDITNVAAGGALSFVEDASSRFGTLTVGDGGHAAAIILFGQFSAAGFQAATDGGAGEFVTYAPAITTPSVAPPH